MIISITIENCLSFKEPTTISFINDREDKRYAVEFNQIFINKSAVLFGANASGKTNFIKALSIFFDRIRFSKGEYTITQTEFDISSGTFKADANKVPDSSFFRQGGVSKFTIDFIADNSNIYRFIFAFDSEKICHEELLVKFLSDSEWHRVYVRELLPIFDSNNNCWQYNYECSDNIKLVPLLFNQDQINNQDDLWQKWKILTSDNQSFLVSATVDSCYQLRSIASSIINCSSSLALHPWVYNEAPEMVQASMSMQQYVIKYLAENHFFSYKLNDGIKNSHPSKLKLLNFLHSIGNRFDDIGLDQFNKIRVNYRQYQHNNTPPYFVHFESSGTIQALCLYQKFHQAITNNMLLIIDEIEVYLHANLCEKLIHAFHEADSKAQLIITSQSPILCDDSLFSRGQIHFLERNRENATEVYRLTDVEGQEKKNNIIWKYLGGQFGAVPEVDEVLF